MTMNIGGFAGGVGGLLCGVHAAPIASAITVAVTSAIPIVGPALAPAAGGAVGGFLIGNSTVRGYNAGQEDTSAGVSRVLTAGVLDLVDQFKR